MKLPLRSLRLSDSVRTVVLVATVLLVLALFVVGVIRWLEEEQVRLFSPSGPAVAVPTLNRFLLEEFAGRLPQPHPF